MPGQLISNSDKVYLKIVGGNLVQTVEKGTKGARLREYELPNKEKGSKWELVYMNWNSRIKSIDFRETEYGEMCNVELEDAILTINTASRYFTDFASKLPGADLSQPFLIHPYDMESEGKKRSKKRSKKRMGVSLSQGGVKLKNYFYDVESKKKLHGFPEINEEKSVKETYWKIYFAEVTEFLIEELKKIQFPTLVPAKPQKAQTQMPENEIESLMNSEVPDDLPF